MFRLGLGLGLCEGHQIKVKSGSRVTFVGDLVLIGLDSALCGLLLLDASPERSNITLPPL